MVGRVTCQQGLGDFTVRTPTLPRRVPRAHGQRRAVLSAWGADPIVLMGPWFQSDSLALFTESLSSGAWTWVLIGVSSLPS